MKLFECWWSKEVFFLIQCNLRKKTGKQTSEHKMKDKKNEYSSYPICIQRITTKILTGIQKTDLGQIHFYIKNGRKFIVLGLFGWML